MISAVAAIFIGAISAKDLKDPHITFMVLLACYSEEMLGANRLDINAIVFKRYSQLITMFILNWQNKCGGNSIVCLAANSIFNAWDAIR